MISVKVVIAVPMPGTTKSATGATRSRPIPSALSIAPSVGGLYLSKSSLLSVFSLNVFSSWARLIVVTSPILSYTLLYVLKTVPAHANDNLKQMAQNGGTIIRVWEHNCRQQILKQQLDTKSSTVNMEKVVSARFQNSVTCFLNALWP